MARVMDHGPDEIAADHQAATGDHLVDRAHAQTPRTAPGVADRTGLLGHFDHMGRDAVFDEGADIGARTAQFDVGTQARALGPRANADGPAKLAGFHWHIGPGLLLNDLGPGAKTAADDVALKVLGQLVQQGQELRTA